MPTGYTAILGEKEDVSLKEFAMLCARNFGACIEMRDLPLSEPIPEKFEPSPFYQKRYEESKKQFDDFMAMEDKKGFLERTYERYVKLEKKRRKENQEKKSILRERYERMLNKIIAWNPPSDEHINLKNFMMKQIKDSIEWDCKDYELKLASKEKWCDVESHIENLLNDVNFYKLQIEKEQYRYDSMNKWLKLLRESF